jgi:elongation factor P
MDGMVRTGASGGAAPINMDPWSRPRSPASRDTSTGARKAATLETGLVVQVPLFVNEGDTIRVDTRNGEYQTRV